MQNNIKKRKRKKKSGFLFKTFVIFLILAIAALVISYVYLDKKLQSESLIDDSTTRKIDMLSKENPYGEMKGIANILLIGDDAREEGELSRADAMFIATIDNVHKKLKLTSINRDAYVQNIPDGSDNKKITDVLSTSGLGTLMYVVEDNFGIKLDGYVKIDFNGFRDLVDAVGGIDIEIPDNAALIKELNIFIDDNRTYQSTYITEAGMNHLDGQQALAYSRIRKTDTTYNRMDRQSEVITAILDKMKTTSVVNYPKMLDVVTDNVVTNIKTAKLLTMASTAIMIKPFAIQKIQTPYAELAYDEQRDDYAWNLFFDMEQNRDFLRKYIYEDIEFDPNQIDEYHLESEIDDYLSYQK